MSLRATGREVFDWILDQGYYSERDTSNVVRQVLEAVAYLHSLKIVHRNLKVRQEPGRRVSWQLAWDPGPASEARSSRVFLCHPHAIPGRSSWRTWCITTG